VSGTRRTPLARHNKGVQITARAVELFAELERACRARRRATDCTMGEHGHCTADCRACRRWWDAHDELHIALDLPPWRWPAIPRNPYPPGSPKARDWRAGTQQEELWKLLDGARRAAATRRTAVSARKEEDATNVEPAGQDTST
jgi:hypothetical protein